MQQAREKAAVERRQGSPRLRQANRNQVELRACDLESLLPEDHRARLVWGYVVHQDLSKLFEAIKARGSNAGRAAIDPRILFALWLYATLDGVGSGREVARLSLEHDAYRWICGGVSVNYHAINDFRAGNEALMDELLTDNVAALAAAGAISLQRVAQDGMRVRADCGSGLVSPQDQPRRAPEPSPRVGADAQDAGAERPGRASARPKRPSCAQPRSAKSASERRSSNCPKLLRPRSARATSPRKPGRAPPIPTHAS